MTKEGFDIASNKAGAHFMREIGDPRRKWPRRRHRDEIRILIVEWKPPRLSNPTVLRTAKFILKQFQYLGWRKDGNPVGLPKSSQLPQFKEKRRHCSGKLLLQSLDKFTRRRRAPLETLVADQSFDRRVHTITVQITFRRRGRVSKSMRTTCCHSPVRIFPSENGTHTPVPSIVERRWLWPLSSFQVASC